MFLKGIVTRTVAAVLLTGAALGPSLAADLPVYHGRHIYHRWPSHGWAWSTCVDPREWGVGHAFGCHYGYGNLETVYYW
jgi:hypothetical protein